MAPDIANILGRTKADNAEMFDLTDAGYLMNFAQIFNEFCSDI